MVFIAIEHITIVGVPAVIIICRERVCVSRVTNISGLQRVCVRDLRIRCPCTRAGECFKDARISSRGNLLITFRHFFLLFSCNEVDVEGNKIAAIFLTLAGFR